MMTPRTQADRNADLAIGRELERKDAEINRLRNWLECIEQTTNDEIIARFGGHWSKTADQLGQRSKVYSLLQMPRDMARRALNGDPYVLPTDT